MHYRTVFFCTKFFFNNIHQTLFNFFFILINKVWPAYQEVQASNLSKACTSEEEAQETVRVRSAEQKEPCHYEQVGKYFIVYRTRDRKVMKNINYFRPDLKQFF